MRRRLAIDLPFIGLPLKLSLSPPPAGQAAPRHFGPLVEPERLTRACRTHTALPRSTTTTTSMLHQRSTDPPDPPKKKPKKNRSSPDPHLSPPRPA